MKGDLRKTDVNTNEAERSKGHNSLSGPIFGSRSCHALSRFSGVVKWVATSLCYMLISDVYIPA
jgi:hypothetical protein